jgi:hypothetical protein
MTNLIPRRLLTGIRSATSPWRNRSGKADANGDAATRSQNGQSRSRRSKNWAVGLGIVVALVASLPIVLGFDWSVLSVCVVVIGLGVALPYANKWTVDWMNERLRRWSPHRFVLAVVLAFPVAAGATMWLFDSDVRAVQTERDPEHWTEETERLRAERVDREAVLATSPPEVFRDSEVIRLQQELATAEDEKSKAENDVLCEEDGTCGTRIPGRAEVYYAKVAHQNELRQQVADLENELAEAKNRVTAAAGKVRENQSRASDRVHEIDERVKQLGSVRPTPPSRLGALFTVVDRDSGRVGGVFIAVFFGFIALDWGVLMLVARRFLHRTDEKDRSIAAKVNERAKKRAQNIKNYDELSPEVRDTSSSTGRGE